LSLYSLAITSATPLTRTCTLSLHDALPIYGNSLLPNTAEPLRYSPLPQQHEHFFFNHPRIEEPAIKLLKGFIRKILLFEMHGLRSEEHTSELQSRENLVCRLLLEKKKTENQ